MLVYKTILKMVLSNIYIEKILKRAGAQKSAYSENETTHAEQTVKNNNSIN